MYKCVGEREKVGQSNLSILLRSLRFMTHIYKNTPLLLLFGLSKLPAPRPHIDIGISEERSDRQNSGESPCHSMHEQHGGRGQLKDYGAVKTVSNPRRPTYHGQIKKVLSKTLNQT
jgi:hypothetical protein